MRNMASPVHDYGGHVNDFGVFSMAVDKDANFVALGASERHTSLSLTHIKGGSDNRVRLWDIDSGQLVFSSRTQTHPVTGVAFATHPGGCAADNSAVRG